MANIQFLIQSISFSFDQVLNHSGGKQLDLQSEHEATERREHSSRTRLEGSCLLWPLDDDDDDVDGS